MQIQLNDDDQFLADDLDLVGVTYHNCDAVGFKVLKKLNNGKYLAQFDDARDDDGDRFFEVHEKEITEGIALGLYLSLYNFTHKEFVYGNGHRILPIRKINNEKWLCRDLTTNKEEEWYIITMYDEMGRKFPKRKQKTGEKSMSTKLNSELANEDRKRLFHCLVTNELYRVIAIDGETVVVGGSNYADEFMNDIDISTFNDPKVYVLWQQPPPVPEGTRFVVTFVREFNAENEARKFAADLILTNPNAIEPSLLEQIKSEGRTNEIANFGLDDNGMGSSLTIEQVLRCDRNTIAHTA